MTTDLAVAHTGQLPPGGLGELRGFLDEVFEGDFSEHDWGHTLGGMHALVRVGGELVGHAALVQRRLLYGDTTLRAGYVEGVGVRADARRQGHGQVLMAALEQLGRAAYDVLALGATDDGARLYAARGWQRWRGPTSALTPAGVVRTREDDGGIWVLPLDVPLDVAADLTCDWRVGDVW